MTDTSSDTLDLEFRPPALPTIRDPGDAEQIAAYNAAVDAYTAEVDRYNAEVKKYNTRLGLPTPGDDEDDDPE